MRPATRALCAALPPGLGGSFPVTGADRAGIPTVSADLLEPTSGTHDHGFGYGHTDDDATVGAYGELVEAVRTRSAARAATPRRESFTALRRELGADAVVDPRELTLPAGTVVDDGRPRDWLPARRWRTGETVWLPAEFCANDPADLPRADPSEHLITMITNGDGAGDTPERAVAHGLLELLQRDGNATAFRAMDAGVVLDLDEIHDPVTLDVLDRLTRAGIEVLPKLSGIRFGVPVVHVVGVDTDPDADPLAMSGCGEAAHPDREVALRKAVLEYAAARARKVFSHAPLERVGPLAPADYWNRELSRPVGAQEPRALEAMRAWTALDADGMRRVLGPVVWSRHETVAFSSLPTVPSGSVGDPADLLPLLLERLDGFDVLVVGGEPAGSGDSGSATAAKVVVPGLEAETMSYGRIGARGVAALLGRGSSLVGLGPPPHDGAAPVVLTAADRERLGDDAWLDLRGVAETVGPLYALYREPSRHALARIGQGAQG